MKNGFASFFHSLVQRFRRPRRTPAEPALSPEQFRELLIQTLHDPETARLLARRLLLPVFPIQGGQPFNASVICPGSFGTDGGCSAGDYAFPNSKVAIKKPSAGEALDVSGNIKASQSIMPGSGYDIRWGDTSTRILGVAGANGYLEFVTNETERMRIDSSGKVGIRAGTAPPLLRLDARGASAKGTTAAFENIFEVASTDTADPLALRAGIKTDATAANRYAGIEVDDGGTKRPLALQPSGGSVVIGGTLAKQDSGGPEKLSFQDSDATKVCVANFVGNEPNARFLLDMDGDLEWSNDGSDQTVVLGCTDIGRMNLAGFRGGGSAGGGLGIVAWKHSQLSQTVNSTQTDFLVESSAPFTGATRIRVDDEICHITSIDGDTLNVTRHEEGTSAAAHDAGSFVVAIGREEAHPRILLSNDGSGVHFSDGSSVTDASISRPAAGRIYLEGDPLLGKSGGKVGFYGTTPIAKPTVTGSRGGNVALANLLTALAQLGLIVDNTSA